jgi:hypothetical protein
LRIIYIYLYILSIRKRTKDKKNKKNCWPSGQLSLEPHFFFSLHFLHYRPTRHSLFSVAGPIRQYGLLPLADGRSSLFARLLLGRMRHRRQRLFLSPSSLSPLPETDAAPSPSKAPAKRRLARDSVRTHGATRRAPHSRPKPSADPPAPGPSSDSTRRRRMPSPEPRTTSTTPVTYLCCRATPRRTPSLHVINPRLRINH